MDQTLRSRPRDIGRARARFLSQRFGQEIRAERLSHGLTQRDLARRAGISQGRVSQIERGVGALSVGVAARMAAGIGLELSVRVFPGTGVRLRDSGQLGLAEAIRSRLPPPAKTELEVPIASDAQDRRAADMLVHLRDGLVMIEIERVLSDVQAQLRRAELKRTALSRRLARPVSLIVAIADTARNRLLASSVDATLRTSMPSDSRTIWRSLGAGLSPPADGLLWIRTPSPDRTV